MLKLRIENLMSSEYIKLCIVRFWWPIFLTWYDVLFSLFINHSIYYRNFKILVELLVGDASRCIWLLLSIFSMMRWPENSKTFFNPTPWSHRTKFDSHYRCLFCNKLNINNFNQLLQDPLDWFKSNLIIFFY